jgi:hypothetical protein
MYQGHCADGSSVQKHSAGALYPLVIAYTERFGYYVLCPDGTELKSISGKLADAYQIGEAYLGLKSVLH